MWTRAELKTRARANLSRYYGPALFVSFIANLFTSKGGSGGSAGSAGGFANGMNAGGEGTRRMERGLPRLGRRQQDYERHGRREQLRRTCYP